MLMTMAKKWKIKMIWKIRIQDILTNLEFYLITLFQ